MPRHILLASLALSASLITSAVLLAPRVTAGPLSPPAGAIAPTYKTLSELDPRIIINSTNTPGDNDATPSTYKISTPGSYVLARNELLPPGKIGIEIASSNVSIDLGGFWLSNFSSLPAISITLSGAKNITLRNGHVSGANGVDLAPTSLVTPPQGATVENLTLADIASTGLATGPSSIVHDCIAINCTKGFSFGRGTVAERCTARSCSDGGFVASEASTLKNCAALNNTGIGLLTQFSCTLEDSTAYGNTSFGIFTSSQSVVRGCTASFNGGDGIVVDLGSLVTHCSAGGNDGDGIKCTYGCFILDNVTRQNGNGAADGAGIHATNWDNRIEGNNCTNNDRGIDVDAAGNVILRNTCASNTTNYTIVAGNSTATIINAAGVGISTSNAFANFEY